MPRTAIYGASLGVFIGATALTLSSILLPRWISYEEHTSSGTISTQLGLHKRCSSSPLSPRGCSHFPTYADCHGSDRYFCSMWRSTGFLMTFALVLEGMNLVAFVAIIAGGRAKRENGWKMLSVLLGINVIIQCIAASLVNYLYDYDDRFFIGWKLDLSWVLATVSWGVTALLMVFISMAGWFLPPEGGYELLK